MNDVTMYKGRSILTKSSRGTEMSVLAARIFRIFRTQFTTDDNDGFEAILITLCCVVFLCVMCNLALGWLLILWIQKKQLLVAV